MSESIESIDQNNGAEESETTESRIESAREEAQEWIIGELEPTVDRYHEKQLQNPTYKMNTRERSVEDVEGMAVCIAKSERDAFKEVLDKLRMN